MIPVIAFEGFFEGIDHGQICEKNTPAGRPILGPFAALSKGSLGDWLQASLSLAAEVPAAEKADPIRRAVFVQRTSRKFRYDALPAREPEGVRLQPPEAVAARAGSRTSSSTPAYRPQCARWVRNSRHAKSRSWAPTSFAPMQVTKSRELRVRASSSDCLVKRALFGPY